MLPVSGEPATRIGRWAGWRAGLERRLSSRHGGGQTGTRGAPHRARRDPTEKACFRLGTGLQQPRWRVRLGTPASAGTRGAPHRARRDPPRKRPPRHGSQQPRWRVRLGTPASAGTRGAPHRARRGKRRFPPRHGSQQPRWRVRLGAGAGLATLLRQETFSATTTPSAASQQPRAGGLPASAGTRGAPHRARRNAMRDYRCAIVGVSRLFKGRACLNPVRWAVLRAEHVARGSC